MCNVSSHMLRSRQITLKCLYSYFICYNWALWSDYHAFLLLTYYPARVCESYNFNYRAYNMIQARQCTLRNDLLVLIVREMDSLFWTILELLAYHPIFWHVSIHTKKSALMIKIEKRPTVTFRDSYIYTPDAFGGTIEN